MDIDIQVIKDIHDRLGRMEGKQDRAVELLESMAWVKRHLWALWASVLALAGITAKGVH